ncbi:hypothetical protein BDZ97DRAFT_1769873 [Flammula alnicola]|nr:hypothetical protein BDZ97DRAFT_1769873 [Flammula alnicola]
MSKNFSRRSAAHEVSPAVKSASTSLQIAGNQAGNQHSHPMNIMPSRIINTGEGSTLSTLSNALDKLSIPPPKKPVKPTGAEGRVASRPFNLNPRSTLPLSSDSDSDSGPEPTAGLKPGGAERPHAEAPKPVPNIASEPVPNIASQPFTLIPRSEIIVSSGSEAEFGPEGILCSQPFALIPRGGHAIDMSDSDSNQQPEASQPFALVDRVQASSGNDVSSLSLPQTHRQQSDESSHEAPPVIDIRKSADALLGDNALVTDPRSPSGFTSQLRLLHSMKAEQLEAILGSDSDSEVGSKGKNPQLIRGFSTLKTCLAVDTAMFGVGNIQQSFDSEAGLAGPSGPPASLACTPKPSWVEVVDAVIDNAHGPNTFFRPPPEARFDEMCLELQPTIKFSYTEQQLYNVHMGVLDSDFDDNTYENKLHVFNSARRNQLQAKILSVNILSEVGDELESIKDLLRP